MNAPLHPYRHTPALLVAREEPSPETACDWSLVHQRIVALREERAAHERELCRWLLAAERLGVHGRAGYASLREYAERTVGLSGRQTEERLRVGRALLSLPLLDGALLSGELGWSAVRELTRVATPESEGEWLAWGKGRRTRELERAVAARRPGDGPGDRADPALVTHRLRFEVRAETMALFRDLQAQVRTELGGEVDDDALLYEIARRALGGPGDDGRASYQVAVSRCSDCGAASIDAGGQTHRVGDDVAEMAACDSQEIGPVNRPRTERPHTGAAVQSIPPAIRRQVMRRDHHRCVVPGCHNHRFLDVHHLDLRADGHHPERLAVLCGSHHRCVHRGELCIDGSASTGFVVRHGDGTPYGAPLRPARLDVAREVLGALQHMGFKPFRARELVDAVLREGPPDDVAEFLRAALRAT